ncbi:hypothetical protein [Paenibacillus elgii]|uniref:hypothetical protein n=1 Tax=Paenibacillus elgii TaxID=189691 RepID=UPI000248D8DD|nr:hypothetical protein [Paenibacillus elgii]
MMETRSGIATTVRERRTINQFNGGPVPKEIIMELLLLRRRQSTASEAAYAGIRAGDMV